MATLKIKLASVVLLSALFGVGQASAQSAPSALVHGVTAIVPLVVRLETETNTADGVPVVWARSNDPTLDRRIVGEVVSVGEVTLASGTSNRGGARSMAGVVEVSPTVVRFTSVAP